MILLALVKGRGNMFFAPRKKRRNISTKSMVKPMLVLTTLLLLLFFSLSIMIPDLQVNDYILLGFSKDDYSTLLVEGLPGLGGVVEFDSLLNRILHIVTSIDSASPASILGYELNFGGWVQAAVVPLALVPTEEEPGGEEDYYLPGQDLQLDEWISIPDNEFPPVQLNGEPMILVYTTHNAESYKPSAGVSKLDGKNGGVAKVSKTFYQAMESRYSIKTIYSDVLHDYPDWTKSYINSMKTVQQVLKKHPSIQLVLDIHRDAGLKTRADTMVKIGNKSCAKVMIVVGTEHARYKENLAFAEKVAAQADKMYPGLIKSIRLAKDRRYNQHLHPRALLLEFGSDLNTQEDSNNSAVLMADVVAAVLKTK